MGAAGTKKLTKAQEARVLQKISEMLLQGIPVRVIAEQIKLIGPSAVQTRIKKLRAQWEEEAALNFATHQAQALAKLRMVQRNAWQMYFKSCKNYNETSKTENQSMQKVGEDFIDTHEDGTKVKRKAEKEFQPTTKTDHKQRRIAHGNPKYLSIVTDCIEKEARLLGVYDWVRMTTLEEGGINGSAEIDVNRQIYIPGKGVANKALVDPAAWEGMEKQLKNQEPHHYDNQ